MTIEGNCKINLALNVTGKRSDGYHSIRTIMQEITLCNKISVDFGGKGVHISCSDCSIPNDEKNIAHKAATLFMEKAGITEGVSIHIEKRIPTQAGLGGGSARCLEWITPNETEAEILTGIKVTDAESAGKAADVLRSRGVKHVVITMGAKGVYCGNCGRIFSAKKVKAVDCVAAGDTFNGAFTVALAEGKSCKDAIAFAQKAAAISVTRSGAQSSIPFRSEM